MPRRCSQDSRTSAIAVPTADAYLIKSCLHNFTDAQVVDALSVIRQADAPLLIAETVVPAGNQPHYAKFDDIEMMVLAGGADRAESQWAELLAAADFTLARTIACDERFSLLEAMPRGQ
ncbi:methyltransferase [Nocardia sp. CA-128927]|uniref:methyltransferase n=1 Tax=Nocardia sp. CA-128927 TaxID=3239975 RepID=UPI003D96717D